MQAHSTESTITSNSNSHANYQPHNYRADIDGLRAIAVLGVVIYHAFPSFLRGGFTGVDVFFVISGFLISNIILKELANNTFCFVDFYSRRIRRIFPCLFVVLLATLAFGWVVLFPDEFKALGKHTAGGGGFISNLLYWQESGYFDSSAESKPLLHLWSLGIEEQFYIFFPLLMFFGWKKKLGLIKSIFFLLLLSFAWNIVLHRSNPIADFYSPFTRFWELLCGVLIAVISRHPSSICQSLHVRIEAWLIRLFKKDPATASGQFLNNSLSVLGFLLILCAAAFTLTSKFPGFRALVPVIGTMLLVLAGPTATINRTILSRRPLVLVGLISYPLYLWHWPMLSYAQILGIGDNSLAILTIVVVSLALSYLTYRFIEIPVRFSKNKALQKRATFVLTILIAGMVAVGGHVYLADGFPGRRSMVNYITSWKETVPPPAPGVHGVAYDSRVPQDKLVASHYMDAGGSETVAVIGDSHAQSAFPGIALLNAEQGVNTFLLAGQGWNPLTTVERASQHNQDLTQLIIAILSDKPDITKVFIISRGPIYWTKSSRPEDHSVTEAIYTDYSSGLQMLTAPLLQAGKKIFVVSENPELPKFIRHSIHRPLKNSDTVFINYRQMYLSRHRSHHNILQSVEGATFVDATNAFCPVDACRIFDDKNQPLYFDDNHLSMVGSVFLANEVLKPYLQP